MGMDLEKYNYLYQENIQEKKMKENKGKITEAKVVGMGLVWKIILWLVGAFFIFIGLLMFYRGIQAGIFMKVLWTGIMWIVAGFIVLPVFNNFTTRYLKIKLSGWLRFFIFVILAIMAAVIFTLSVSKPATGT